jgi:hypothetical protein
MTKNINKGCLIAVVLLGILILACVISVIIPENSVKVASSMLRIDLPKGTTILIDDDSGPSFPTGDGYTWMVLQVPHEEIIEFANSLETSPVWKPLPLPPELAENRDYLQPTIMSGVEGTIPIATSTGYYLFIDSQEEYSKLPPP